MKILIAYAGKSGTTEKCAKKLSEMLTNATTVDLNRQTPDIEKFDTVIVGGAIRMGQLHKKAKRFIQQNLTGLKTKKTAYFICCSSVDDVQNLFENNFPKELLDAATSHECFGGEMNVESLHGFDKLVGKIAIKATAAKKIAPPKINDENIAKLADQVVN